MPKFTSELPGPAHRQTYGQMMDRWEQLENSIQPELLRRGTVPFEKWLEYCEDDRTTGSMLSIGVPCTLYFMADSEGEIVGGIVLNHADTKWGHLHAGIAPWHRGKGYGSVMLTLALAECRKRGITKVHICPNSRENRAAVRTILSCGGRLLEEFSEDGHLLERYEIDLT